MRKMSDREALEFLADGARTGKLALTDADGAPHVAAIWFVVDGGEIVFMTGAETRKGRSLRRDGRAALLVDDERPPFAYVRVEGTVDISDDHEAMLPWSIRIAGRYMGDGRAKAFGRRNAVPGELLVRLRPTRIVGMADIAD